MVGAGNHSILSGTVSYNYDGFSYTRVKRSCEKKKEGRKGGGLCCFFCIFEE